MTGKEIILLRTNQEVAKAYLSSRREWETRKENGSQSLKIFDSNSQLFRKINKAQNTLGMISTRFLVDVILLYIFSKAFIYT